MAATFAPPHPVSVFRYLKQAYRDYVNGGTAAFINVTTPPTHAASAITTVAGTVEVDALSGVPMPANVTATVTQGGTTKGTFVAGVNPTTGAYSASFAGSICVAGTATATVSCVNPAETTTTPAFTLT